MKRILASVFALSIMGQSVTAQEDDGASLMEQGAQQFLEGLLQEMEPALEGMRGFFDEMGPAFVELMDEIKDWSAYDPPEVLENGDIIIRRKPDGEDSVPEPVEPMPQIEL